LEPHAPQATRVSLQPQQIWKDASQPSKIKTRKINAEPQGRVPARSAKSMQRLVRNPSARSLRRNRRSMNRETPRRSRLVRVQAEVSIALPPARSSAPADPPPDKKRCGQKLGRRAGPLCQLVQWRTRLAARVDHVGDRLRRRLHGFTSRIGSFTRSSFAAPFAFSGSPLQIMPVSLAAYRRTTARQSIDPGAAGSFLNCP
jgi:hypothetical protein